MELFITDNGSSKRVMALLKTGAGQAANTQTVMERIAIDMMRVEKQVFQSQGRRGGGSWTRLKATTIKKKGIGGNNILRTDLARAGYSKIDGVQSSDTLYKSLTRLGSEYQIFRVMNDNVVFGTDRPYAGVHQQGSWLRNIPARPFLRFLPSDQQRWIDLISVHLMEPFLRDNK
jgi:phage gpG-like protein